MVWKGATVIAMVLYLAIAQPSPLEQLEIVCAAVVLSGALFHSFTVWRVRQILGDGDSNDKKKTTRAK